MVDTKFYFHALAGKLRSKLQGNLGDWYFHNATCMKVVLYWITPGGAQAGINPDTTFFEEGYPGVEVPAGAQVPLIMQDGSYVITMSASGGLAGVFVKDVDSPDGVTMTSADLLDPGDVGPIPEPDADRPIPPDSPRVVVGCGTVRGEVSNVVVREQYWRLAADSYALGPNETRTVSYSETSGMETTTSEQNSMAAALNVSASGGWGPVSASVSASLSASTTTFQQVTLSTQQTKFVSRTLEPAAQARTVLYWQLTEVITVFHPDSSTPLASSVTGLEPILPRTVPGSLPPSARRARMTAEDRAGAPRIGPGEGRSRAGLPRG